MGQRLVLLYDSDPGIFSALMDAGKRLMNDPSTCPLYRLTHGLMFERRVWSEFLARQPMTVTYAHRRFEGLGNAPAVLKEQDGSVSVMLDADEIGRCKNIEELMSKIERGLLTGFAG